ncbi:MAG: hypothetical protein ACPL2N_05295 [Candidatus Cryosericum sp.]
MKDTSKVISILLVFALLFALTPFIKPLNFSDCSLLAVSINPSKKYAIDFDLPHLKSVDTLTRESANNNITKTFNFKDGTIDYTRPSVEIEQNSLGNSYSGLMRYGNIQTNFERIILKFKHENSPTTDTLLEGRLTLNSKPLRANIFLMENGSLLQYASVTIQDEMDNVLAMFTHGKADEMRQPKDGSEDAESTDNGNQEAMSTLSTNSLSANSSERVLRSYVKDMTIGDPFGGTPPITVHALRTDAMAQYPFSTSIGTLDLLSLRSWGFRKPLTDAYRAFYQNAGYNPSLIYVDFGASSVDHIIETKFQSGADATYSFPQPSGYTTVPLGVSFPLYGYGSIGYTIGMPVGGVSKAWTYKQTAGSIPGMNNYAELAANSFYNCTWNDNSLFWPDNDTNPYISNPGSSFGGFYSHSVFLLQATGPGFTARYTSSYLYSIGVGILGQGADIYYLSSYNTFDPVTLD